MEGVVGQGVGKCRTILVTRLSRQRERERYELSVSQLESSLFSFTFFHTGKMLPLFDHLNFRILEFFLIFSKIYMEIVELLFLLPQHIFYLRKMNRKNVHVVVICFVTRDKWINKYCGNNHSFLPNFFALSFHNGTPCVS